MLGFKWTCSTSFYSTHCLDWWGVDHECAQPHGHRFAARVVVKGSRTASTVDLAALRDTLEVVTAALEGAHLNDVIDDPSCEGIGKHIVDLINAAGFIVDTVEITEDGRTGVLLTVSQ